MRPYSFDIDPANVDPDGIAENQTTGGAANLVLNGALADLGTALQFDIGDAYSNGCGGVRIAIDSAGDISTVNFTVTGKDQDGISATEVITGVTTTAVESTTYWSQITTIAADAAVASNVFVGPVDEVVTKTLPLNYRDVNGATYAVDVTGTVDYTVNETLDQIHTITPSGASWFAVTALSAKTADLMEVGRPNATACQLVINSYTDTAEIAFTVMQNESN